MSSASCRGDAIVAAQQQVLRVLRVRRATASSIATMPLPKLHFGCAEAALLGRDGDVAGEGELHRAAQAVAVHGGERRLRANPRSA